MSSASGLLFFALPLVGLLGSALKWHVVLADRSFVKALQLHWAGDFLSLAGLGSLGNDVYKFLALRDRAGVVRDIITVRLIGSIGGTLAAVLVAISGRAGVFSVIVAVPILALLLRPFALSQMTLTRLALLAIAVVQMSVVVLLFHLLLLSFSSATVEEAAVLAVADLWAMVLPISYQGIGVREATFSFVGQTLQSSGPTFFLIASLLSTSTVIVRLFGIFPYFHSRRHLRRGGIRHEL